MQALGILGGTFDPVHCGHLRLAIEMREHLALARVHLIPVRVPPHRGAPHAEPRARLSMLEAAVRGAPELHVDDRELRREGPSYTVDTLISLREDYPDQALCLLLGMDAFAGLASWHRWRELLELAHIGVAQRPGAGAPLEGEVARLFEERRAPSAQGLNGARAGSIFVCEVPALDVSASRIRRLLAAGRSVRYLVPDPTLDIILEDRIYID
ncbi:MAG: nicotinate-nucleotide adenylyltransferase [Gammaproteobacteria bacterium]|nr:nicotinate-nucleotide adenylyltransferase [Gammaproteobacteria bacterium]NIR83677.1 nicotinate-nucleotide adenylyltransferase [Gammaproteobacteria bacterium]NIR91652.1 nicotinate-nucleotide adenylyltransferase [Gammaproteobacteria bacterium]NIU04839.1 nicotinate-nucleotide adenylyltransferase [Gammaproteobacteria bacterium]NIV51825.1 nicotinate-nucleotide adenylyltransferase [Gammaproteobacteria bacterium]